MGHHSVSTDASHCKNKVAVLQAKMQGTNDIEFVCTFSRNI